MGCLEIVLALCGDCKLRKSLTIFHLLPSIPQCFTAWCIFSLHSGKRGAEPHRLAADCTVWIYANPRLSASELTAQGVWFMSLSSAIMWLSSLSGGWMCGSLCLVIRTVNDRDAWREREGAGGSVRAWWLGWGVRWRFEPYQGFTAGHNSMCGDCVEGLASRARASPRGLLCVGAAAFAFRAFPLLLVVCSMSLFSRRRSIWREIRKKENITMAPVMCDLSLIPPPFHLFLFYVVLAALSVMRGFENRQRWGIYILANFSNGFLTRKHILQFLSILVFLRLSAAVSLTSASRAFADYSAPWVSSKTLNFPIFTAFST